MLTIFGCPKSFGNAHAAMIQHNAIRSWTLLNPRPEIMLLGNDEGTSKMCQSLGLRFVPEVTCNEYGTPLVSDLFEKAYSLASHRVLCYVNADIILMNDFMRVARLVMECKRRFLIVGRRWDVGIARPLDFESDWEDALRAHITQNGRLHPPTGTDYFIFTRGVWEEIPPFAVGRSVWDNWLIYGARSSGTPVIDATEAITAVHQNHDYSHLKLATDEVPDGPEIKLNRDIAGGWKYIFTVSDATHVLVTRRNGGPYMLRRNLRTAPVSVLKACKQMSYWVGAGTRFVKRRAGWVT